jgi:tRNA modification GTPase
MSGQDGTKSSMNKATIAAISTPFGSGGIGIIRISGDQSIDILKSVFQRTGKRTPTENLQTGPFVSHRFYHGHIIDTHTRQRIDEVLAVSMQAPRSYTREDVVEIHSHSGPVVLGNIFRQVIDQGARVADPGEFTRRAYLNGRIDLTQAEAVIDIIQAKTETALQIANRQLAGGLTESIYPIRDNLLSIRVLLETAIDFPEDVEEDLETQSILNDMDQVVIEKIEQLLSDYQADHFYRDGVKMAIIGKPNVGKSSLMNRLLDRDRAIVTAIPGTTRDVIEEMFHINGLPVIIMDTAGLHDATGEVEKIGIEKTHQTIEDADIVLFVIDSSGPPTHEDAAIYKHIETKKHLLVKNKIDLIVAGSDYKMRHEWMGKPLVGISALTGEHIEALKRAIWSLAVGDLGVGREIGIVPNMRHKLQLEACLISAKRARDALEKGLPAEMVAADIMQASDALGTILGDQCPMDLLDQIFSRFCIGK